MKSPCLSAGLACAAVEAVLSGELDNAYSLSRPPGHHCLPDQSMGFCFRANIPIAVERAKARFGLGKVAILDWDVHHGNGTQHIYLHRDDVLTISLHQDGWFSARLCRRGRSRHRRRRRLQHQCSADGRRGGRRLALMRWKRSFCRRWRALNRS